MKPSETHLQRQVDTLLASMEKASSAGQAFSRYGSDTHKQVYIYGGLQLGPTLLVRVQPLGSPCDKDA